MFLTVAIIVQLEYQYLKHSQHAMPVDHQDVCCNFMNAEIQELHRQSTLHCLCYWEDLDHPTIVIGCSDLCGYRWQCGTHEKIVLINNICSINQITVPIIAMQ